MVSAQLFRKLIQLSFGDRYRAPNFNGNLTLPQMSLQFTQCRIEQSVILTITKSDKIINLIRQKCKVTKKIVNTHKASEIILKNGNASNKISKTASKPKVVIKKNKTTRSSKKPK